MKESGSIPEWLLLEESYEPKKDRSTNAKGAGAPLKIAYMVYFIILIACSGNMFFSYCILAGILLHFLCSCFCRQYFGDCAHRNAGSYLRGDICTILMNRLTAEIRVP